MYDTLMISGLLFVAGAGVGSGIARGDWTTVVLCAGITLVTMAALHLRRQTDQCTSHRDGYIAGKADGILAALNDQEGAR